MELALPEEVGMPVAVDACWKATDRGGQAIDRSRKVTDRGGQAIDRSRKVTDRGREIDGRRKENVISPPGP